MRNLLIALSCVIFSVILGCSSELERKVNYKASEYGSKDFVEALVTSVEPVWFSQDKKFSLAAADGSPAAHMFYDADPAIDLEERSLNFIAVTPQNLPVERKLNLASGQLYTTRKYCGQSDAWGEYKETIGLPPYTTGVVPRTIDQIGEPQKIIVFGQDGYYQSFHLKNHFDARVVGGFIEQICPSRGCVENETWLSRLTLVGVQKNNKEYKDVRNLEDLKKKVDWRQVKAFAGNGGGKNNVGGKYYPAYRMGAEVEASQALAFFEKNSKTFSLDELNGMASGCRKLYDFLTESLSQEPENFDRNFKNYLRRFGNRVVTCEKYVYPFSVNEEPEKHWFFSYVSGYFKLHDLGYFYDCERQVWSANPVDRKGKRLKGPSEVFQGCVPGHVDKAMNTMVRYLEVLKEADKQSFRYVAYDGRSHGTHSKIYGWVDSDNKTLECSEKLGEKKFKHALPTYPEDMTWKKAKAAILVGKAEEKKKVDHE